MPGLELLSAETISHSYKAAREIFLGGERPAEQKEAESDEVTNVEGHENLPPQDKQELGQCHRFKIKGKKDSCCERSATVRPYQGVRNYLVYCAECWKIRREANRESCKQWRVTKKAKIKHEKQNILNIVDNGKLWGLNLVEEQ